MEGPVLTRELLITYRLHLRTEEHAPGTIEKYLRDLRALSLWLEERRLPKELAAEWKAHLLSAGYMPVTINSMLAALNGLVPLSGLGLAHQVSEDPAPHVPGPLNRPEYDRLVEAARGSGKERLALLMEAICATGVRVSEVKYLSVEAGPADRAEISLKRQDTGDPAGRQVMPQAFEIRKSKNNFRRHFSHQKRKVPVAQADMGRMCASSL
ncbi:MAG: site-specific integrase [Intestinimonas sp.]